MSDTKKKKKKKQKNAVRELSSEEKQIINAKNLVTGYIIGYIIVCVLALEVGHAISTNSMESVIGLKHEITIASVLSVLLENMSENPFNVFPLTLNHLLTWLLFSIIYGGFALFRYTQYLRFKQTMPNESHGTAKWNTDYEGFAKKYSTSIKDSCHNKSILERLEKEEEEDIVKETPEIDMNLIFTSKNKLSFDNKKTQRNSNTIIMGGSGTGKSFSYIEPNIAQSNSSFVITDPSGEIYQNMNKFLVDEGYVVKVLNLKYYERGNHYNPFDYIRRKPDGTCDQSSVMAMVAAFLDNTGGGKEEAFWRDSANALFCAAAFLLIETRPYKDWTMANVSKIIRQAKKDESSSSSTTAFDTLMQKAGATVPNSMAYSFYQTFKLASPKTAESILVSTDVKLSKFSIPEINRLTTTDLDDIDNNVNLNAIGDKKTALFIITQTGGGPCDFLASMLYNQLFDIVYDRCETFIPTKHHLYSHNGYPLETMFETPEDAMKHAQTIQGCTVKEDEQKKVFYLETSSGKPLFQRMTSMNPDIDKYYKPIRVEFSTKGKAQHYVNEYANVEVRNSGIRTPWAITCLLDEFNNIGEIPKFDQILATCRKYNLNLSIVLQNLAQLKGRYEKTWNTILGNCDNFLFLGSSELDTCKYVSEVLGRGTIIVRNESRSSGKTGEANYSFQSAARELLDPSELARLDNSLCIYIMRGERPFKVAKNNFSKHVNFNRTGCASSEWETTQEEMKTVYDKPVKKAKRKRNRIKEKQEKFKPTEVKTAEDVMESVNAYTPTEAVKNVEQPKKPVQNTVDAITNIAKANITTDENGTEEWEF